MHKPKSVLEKRIKSSATLKLQQIYKSRTEDRNSDNYHKEMNLSSNGFTVLEDHKRKIKESEKLDKYLDLARKMKKLWNMKVTVISIVVGALGTFPQKSGKETL